MSAETPSRIHIRSIEFFCAGAAAIKASCKDAESGAGVIEVDKGIETDVSSDGSKNSGDVTFSTADPPSDCGSVGVGRGDSLRGSRRGDRIRAFLRGFMFGSGDLPGGGSGNSTVSFFDWFGPAMR